MKITRQSKGFTLIELLVVIGIIALLASIAVPAFQGAMVKGSQMKALSNAKQIATACRTYAIDNNGSYPTYQVQAGGVAGTNVVGDSNDAFDNLFPQYLTDNSIFYLSKSAFTPTQQTEPTQDAMNQGAALPAGTNEWAYVTGLYDTSNSSFPLVADGFNQVGSHAYTNNETQKGGVWKGLQAIVVFVDTSGRLMNTNHTTFIVPGSPNGNDLFDTSGQPGWMTQPSGAGGGGNTVVNPE